MSPAWKIEVHPDIVGIHQWSILSGIAGLRSSGLADVKTTWLRPTESRASLTVRVTDLRTGRQRVGSFEMHDGAAFDAWNVQNVDVIFKRSYDSERLAAENPKATVLPLGLTLGCLGRGVSRIAASSIARLAVNSAPFGGSVGTRRILSSSRAALGAALTTYVGKRLAHPYITIGELESFRTSRVSEPYVSFMVRAWDPAAASSNSKGMFVEVSDRRAALIRRLRARFGHRFVGGFVPTEFAKRQYPDCIAEVSTAQRDFLRTVGHGGVGVSTRGLANSNPWKLAEYLALGTAIVTEPLVFSLPEALEVGINILEFGEIEDCIDRCQMLFDDPAVRVRMQQENWRYWCSYVRPKELLIRRLNELFINR